MSPPRILFIEDDRAGREMGVFNLERAGYEVDAAASGEAGLDVFDPKLHELVITDIRMPGMSGIDVLTAIRAQAPEVPVLVITAYAEVELAVDTMKRGAFDFIGKPFNRDHLLLTVQKALESRALREELRRYRIKASGVERPIIHASDQMADLLAMADRVAAADATVLITGESGTGKELIARRIHVKSTRAEGPFVPVNVAAMPRELLEAELFGHEKGAFTGASKPRIGRFRNADKGTLFLDEIGEMPTSVQGKLLRVLQERIIEPLGTDTPAPVDVRIVAATNRRLAEMVKNGAFRDDLYYRINVVELSIPALRERPADILPLARHFISTFTGRENAEIPRPISERLLDHTWPGNVRELENTCQRLVLLSSDGALSVDDLPPAMTQAPPSLAAPGLSRRDAEWPDLPPEGISLVDLERRIIDRVLALKAGNVTQAALYLKVPRHVLAYRMEKHGIPRKQR